MPEVTLESLAARVAAVERELAALKGVSLPSRDWQSVVGIIEETEFTRRRIAAMEAAREADRQAALEAADE